MKLIVNPTKMLGGDDVNKLWNPKEENISKLVVKLDKHVINYFNSKYCLNDFDLTRIDFTVNINVGSNDFVSAYIKVLHKLGKVKGYSKKYTDDDDKIDKNLSFDLEGNSNGIEFTAYDKKQNANGKKPKVSCGLRSA